MRNLFEVGLALTLGGCSGAVRDHGGPPVFVDDAGASSGGKDGTGGTQNLGGSGRSGGAAGGGTGGAVISHDGGHPDCVISTESTIPGVHIEFPAEPRCVFTLAEAAAGIQIPYVVVVESRSLVAMRYTYQAGPDYDDPSANESHHWAGLLEMHESIDGNDQSYCYCDLGPSPGFCMLPDGGISWPTEPCGVVLEHGTFPISFYWDGVNWSGPSDTGNPKGAPFPPGDYVLTVKTSDIGLPVPTDGGSTDSGIGPTETASASAKFLIRLVQ